MTDECFHEHVVVWAFLSSYKQESMNDRELTSCLHSHTHLSIRVFFPYPAVD